MAGTMGNGSTDTRQRTGRWRYQIGDNVNAASIENSKRLQRVDDLLSTGKRFSTLEIIQYANVAAVTDGRLNVNA
jgi:hypothetical protein